MCKESIITKQGFRARGFTFGVASDNHFYLEVFSGNFTSSLVNGRTQVQAGIWYHVAAIYEYQGNNAGRVRLYVNGVEDGGTDSAVGPLRTNTQSLDIGRYGWLGYYLDGLIDEVRIYSRVLSPAEIASLAD